MFFFVRHSVLFAATLLVAVSTINGQSVDAVTSALKHAGISERFGESIPLDTELVDESGATVRLGDIVNGERPVILTFVYHTCPMLCSMVLEAVTQSIRDIDWTPGIEYEILTVSIGVDDTPTSAATQKERYLKKFGRPEAAPGWHFLTGEPSAVRSLADAVGFGYDYDEESGEYGHAAVVILLSPDGKVNRYLYGINYPSFDLRAGLVEASEGRVGNIVDRLIMYCFLYDPAEGSYVPQAWLAMRLAGGFTVVLLAGLLAMLWRRERDDATIVSHDDEQGPDSARQGEG